MLRSMLDQASQKQIVHKKRGILNLLVGVTDTNIGCRFAIKMLWNIWCLIEIARVHRQ